MVLGKPYPDSGVTQGRAVLADLARYPATARHIAHKLSCHFVADEPLEAVEARLRAAGFPPEGTIVDQEWGRSLLVPGPDGTIVQIDEPDRELYT